MHLLPFSSCLLRSSSLIGLTASKREKERRGMSKIEREKERRHVNILLYFHRIAAAILKHAKTLPAIEKFCTWICAKNRDNGEKSEAGKVKKMHT